jgi:hypothetical protein
MSITRFPQSSLVITYPRDRHTDGTTIGLGARLVPVDSSFAVLSVGSLRNRGSVWSALRGDCVDGGLVPSRAGGELLLVSVFFRSIDPSGFSPRLWRRSFDVDVVNERKVQLGGHIILKTS